MKFKILILIGLFVIKNSIFAIENIDEQAIEMQRVRCKEKLEKAIYLYNHVDKNKAKELTPLFEEVYHEHLIETKWQAASYLAEIYRRARDFDESSKYYRELLEQNYDLELKNYSLFCLGLISRYDEKNIELSINQLLEVDYCKCNDKIIISAVEESIYISKINKEKGKLLYNKIKPFLDYKIAFKAIKKYSFADLLMFESEIIIDLLNICIEQKHINISSNFNIIVNASFILARLYYSKLEDFDKAKDYFNFVLCQICKLQNSQKNRRFIELVIDGLDELKQKASYYLQLIETKKLT